MSSKRFTVIALASLAWCSWGDFGVPSIIFDSGLVGFSANQLRDSLNDMLGLHRRIPTNLNSDHLRLGAGNISSLVLNITEIGFKLANEMNKAAGERNVPVKNVFHSLDASVEDLKLFLMNRAPGIVSLMKENLKNVTAGEIDSALNGMKKSLEDASQALKNLESAINSVIMVDNAGTTTPLPGIIDISNSFTQQLSKDLGKLRDQVKVLNKAIEASVKSIEASNTFLDSIISNKRSVGDAFKSSLSLFNSTVDNELASTTNKYLSAKDTFHQDFAEAIQRLKIFVPNTKLNTLVDLTKEEYTKFYYQLYSRNDSDQAAISDAYDGIRSNLTEAMNKTLQRFFDDLDISSSAVVSTILTRGQYATQCSDKFSSRITGPIFGFQLQVTNCVSRERGRLTRITEAIDKVLQLAQSSSKDFTTDVGSCSRFGGFANNEMDYAQAKGCLESNFRESGKYSQLIGAQLDVIKTILTVEMSASDFRTGQCVRQAISEESAVLESAREGVLRCMVDGP